MLEMICDYLGAGRAYMGKNFTIKSEYKWWLEKRKTVVMYADTLATVDKIFQQMALYGIEYVLSDRKLLKNLKIEYDKNYN